MKFISTTLAAYLVFLTFLPCSDSEDWYVFHDNEQIGVEFCEPSHEGHEHNESDCHDTCPLFCYCGCCQILLDAPLDFSLRILRPPLVSIATSPSFEIQIFDFELIDEIWQPPRMS